MGEVITEQNIRFVRPGYGVHLKYLKDVLGTKAQKNYEFGNRFNI